MATPPFNINEAAPADTDPVSAFPSAERDFRDTVEDAMAVEHDMNTAGSSARHKFGIGNDAARDAITDWPVGAIWFNTATSPATLQRVVSVGPVVWENVTASGLLGLANTWTAVQIISVGTAGTALQLISSDSSASQGPDLNLWRNSASPTASDVLGSVLFNGEDSGGNIATYAAIHAILVDPTDGSEDGEMFLRTLRAGATADWRIQSGTLRYQGLNVPANAGEINAVAFYKNNAGPATMLVQSVTVSTATFSELAGSIPEDDTVPTSSEGTEILSQSFTPRHASSTIIIRVFVMAGTSGTNTTCTVALFQGTTNLRTVAEWLQTSVSIAPLALYEEHAAASTSPRTYSVRAAGESANLMDINGKNNARLFGGSLRTYMVIEEWL